MDELNMDFIANGSAQGDVASLLQANGRLDTARMRPYIANDGKAYITVFKGGNLDPKLPTSYAAIQVNAGTLRREEWMALDSAVLQIAETRLNGIQDLISAGLVYNLGNAMGTTVLETQTLSDALDAELSMDGVSRAKNDRAVFGSVYLPIPILHADYQINARVLAASRNMGNPLDSTNAERAARKVAEKLEAMLFGSQTYSYGNGTIYGYANYPDRAQLALSKAWNDATKTGADIIADVSAMKQKAIADKHYGPYVLYVPTAYETVLDQDYATSKEGTIRERILKINNIKDVKVNDTLAANNVLLVQMTSDVVRLVRGLPIQNVQWKSEGEFVNNYKVLTIQVPQIRSDANKKTGIVHLAQARCIFFLTNQVKLEQ